MALDDEKYGSLYLQRATVVQAKMDHLRRQYDAQDRAAKLYPITIGTSLAWMVAFGLTVFEVAPIPLMPLAIGLAIPMILVLVMYGISHSQD